MLVVRAPVEELLEEQVLVQVVAHTAGALEQVVACGVGSLSSSALQLFPPKQRFPADSVFPNDLPAWFSFAFKLRQLLRWL